MTAATDSILVNDNSEKDNEQKRKRTQDYRDMRIQIYSDRDTEKETMR